MSQLSPKQSAIGQFFTLLLVLWLAGPGLSGVAAMQKEPSPIEIELIVPEHAEYVGALGAAIIAGERKSHG